MKIWHITDTHGFHDNLIIPEDIDMVIHTGDCSNTKTPYLNEHEVWNFIDWYKKIPIIKLFIPGNHDTSIEHKLVTSRDFLNNNILMLEHESVIIDNIKFFGSPYTPSFGTNWSYNKSRTNLGKLWTQLPNDINVLLTHGPPLGILDLTEDEEHNLNMCGDRSLLKFVLNSKTLKYHLFGHIHNSKDCINNAIKIYNGITFSNSCPLVDGYYDKGLISNGNLIKITI